MALSPFSIGSGGFRPAGITFPAVHCRGDSCGHFSPSLCCEISHHAFHSSEGIRSFACQAGDCDDDTAERSILRSSGSIPHSLAEAHQVLAN